MPSTHRTPHLAIAVALAFVLLAGFTATSAPARTEQADSAITVPVSEYNARWPREPASGPLPPAAVPAATPVEPRNHTAVPVVAGLLLLAACTAAATGVRVRPRRRRRVAA